MSDTAVQEPQNWRRDVAMVLAFILVVCGMANNFPNVPGDRKSVV